MNFFVSLFDGFSNFGMALIFVFFTFVILFVLLREVNTWYWKINEILSVLYKIEQNTQPKNGPEEADKV